MVTDTSSKTKAFLMTSVEEGANKLAKNSNLSDISIFKGINTQYIEDFSTEYENIYKSIKIKASQDPKGFWQTLAKDDKSLKDAFGAQWENIKSNWTKFQNWFKKTFNLSDQDMKKDVAK